MQIVTKFPSTLAGIILATLCSPGNAQESTADSIASMMTNGKTSLNLRYRYEFVDDERSDNDAKASTVRSRLTFASASYQGFSFLTEFDNVTNIGSSKFNSTANGKTEYPVVADPKGTELNQAWLQYKSGKGSAAYGRQRINHGNQRFVGGVGWRQNEQTYDGFRAQWNNGSGLKIDYAFIHNVNRIFGPDDGPVQPADLRGDNNFLRIDWKFAKSHTLSGFGYNIEIDEESDYPAGRSVGNSSTTFGVEYTGKFGPFAANAAYASQSDAGDSPLDYDADYYFVSGSYAFSSLKVTLGYEVLGADNGVGFKTPFATLHKFQGWADKFLVTPGDGIEDAYVGLAGSIGPVKVAGFYHDFKGEDSSDSFGQEFDLVATWPINKQFSVQAKYADFSSDDDSRFSDTTKAWLTLNFNI